MNCEIKTRGMLKMIVMDVRIDNFYAFKNFHMNMSYPKKIVNSYIENEYLSERQNFRYKKVNILMGANATGKTSFGQMLMSVFNFMERKEISLLLKNICDTSKEAFFSMDFVLNEFILYSIQIVILPSFETGYTDKDIMLKVEQVNINKNDSYESCKQRLNTKMEKAEYKADYVNELEKLSNLYWLFVYPERKNKFKFPKGDFKTVYLKVLEKTLKALDPSIIGVEEMDTVEDSYIIRMRSKSVIVQEGSIVNESILSSGTKSGIEIANIVASILTNRNQFYYCDEKFSFVHSEIEKAFLAIMIDSLGPNEQLFFTTHNMDILDLNLPKHSYTFMKKDIYYDEHPIKCICANEILKRNTDSLRSAVENDLFCTAPSVDSVYDIVS